MPLIDPRGLLYGERLGDCSDEAQLHWPRLFSTSNGYGRTELSIERIHSTIYSSFKKKPTEAQLSKWFQEYQDNFLLFIYQAPDGSLWGQWITSEQYLPKYKTKADENSPSPNYEAVEEFKKAYISSRKAKYLSIQRFHKSSETSQTFSTEEVVEEVVDEDTNTLPNGRESAEADLRPEDFANAWNRERGPLPKVSEFSKSRRQKTSVRMHAGLTLEKFTEAIARCRGVPFLRGENDRGWRADYDWLMANDTNIAKVLEGKYDGGGKGNGANQSTRFRTKTDGNIHAAREAIESILGDSADSPGDGEAGDGGAGGFEAVRQAPVVLPPERRGASAGQNFP